jgi:hypothetical protein
MITEIVKRATVCRQSQSRIHLLYPLTSTTSTSIILFFKHSFGILALSVLLRALQTFAEEDHTLFETEFRLMIMTGDPDHDMVTVEGEDGTMWPGKWEDDANKGKGWLPGVKARDANGNWRMSYMAWSRPSEKERTMWHHHKDQEPDSGRKVHYLICNRWRHQLMIVYHSLEPRSQSSPTRLVYL